MTQPSFVPIAEADQVRPARPLEVPRGWAPTRPADLRGPGQPSGPRLGAPGPDQGYALRLARRVEPTLVLGPGDAAEDVVVGCALVASRRAGLFGRAPTIYDVNLAVALFGWAGPVPGELAARRSRAFRGVAHEYALQRALVDTVPEATLAMTPEEVADGRDRDWEGLTGLAAPGA